MISPAMTARVSPDMDEQTPTVQPVPTGDGMVALSYFLSGILFYGGLGWAGSRYLGQTWMLPVGLILGFVASTYLVIKRYSSVDVATGPSTHQTQTPEKEQ